MIVQQAAQAQLSETLAIVAAIRKIIETLPPPLSRRTDLSVHLLEHLTHYASAIPELQARAHGIPVQTTA